jgi:predicted nuclease of predicted toxin-antitoxin system
MRLLADKNVPGPLVRALVDGGCDVERIRITSPGISDPEVLPRAIATDSVLITFDKDFGEIARGSALPSAFGVILLRVPMPAPPEMARLAAVILSRTDWAGRFTRH